MEEIKLKSRVARNKWTIVSLVFLFFALSVFFTFIQDFRYLSRAKVLVVQSAIESDAYTYSRISEYLSGILAEVVLTNSFYNRVLEAGEDIDKSYFSGNINEQMKIWAKTVKAGPINDTGIINIRVYHKDKIQAEKIMEAVVAVLISGHGDYHGGGKSIALKTIDAPAISDYPVDPNIALNLILGIASGFFVALVYVYLAGGGEKKPELYTFGFGKNTISLPAEPVRSLTDLAKLKEEAFKNLKYQPVSPVKESGALLKEKRFLASSFEDEEETIKEILDHGSMKNIFGQ